MDNLNEKIDRQNDEIKNLNTKIEKANVCNHNSQEIICHNDKMSNFP